MKTEYCSWCRHWACVRVEDIDSWLCLPCWHQLWQWRYEQTHWTYEEPQADDAVAGTVD